MDLHRCHGRYGNENIVRTQGGKVKRHYVDKQSSVERTWKLAKCQAITSREVKYAAWIICMTQKETREKKKERIGNCFFSIFFCGIAPTVLCMVNQEQRCGTLLWSFSRLDIITNRGWKKKLVDNCGQEAVNTFYLIENCLK